MLDVFPLLPMAILAVPGMLDSAEHRQGREDGLDLLPGLVEQRRHLGGRRGHGRQPL
jgi:hypothetical protein